MMATLLPPFLWSMADRRFRLALPLAAAGISSNLDGGCIVLAAARDATSLVNCGLGAASQRSRAAEAIQDGHVWFWICCGFGTAPNIVKPRPSASVGVGGCKSPQPNLMNNINELARLWRAFSCCAQHGRIVDGIFLLAQTPMVWRELDQWLRHRLSGTSSSSGSVVRPYSGRCCCWEPCLTLRDGSLPTAVAGCATPW